MRLPRLLTAAVLLGGLIVLSGQPAFAADCAEGDELKAVPWAQKMLPPEKVAPFATGEGVVVATLDTGAAASHVQLKGHVLAGTSFVTGRAKGRGDSDCVGHGTGIASVIVGQGDSPATGFRGLAPGATILPVKVTEGDPKAGGVEGENTGGERVDARGFAAALDWAVAQGADVVNMSLKFDRPDDAIKNSIAAAVRKGVVLVASGGNDHSDELVAKTGVDTVSYPVGYEGVIGVGSVTAQGVRSPESELGPWIDIAAPGENVHFATPDGAYSASTGTSLAAAFVSATAALVIEARPELRGKGAEVAARILATASPAPGGMGSLAYGAGIVDPYRAVTDDMPGDDQARASMAPMEIAAADPAVAAAARDREVATDRAMVIGAVLAGATVLVLAVVGALRRGRRRGWHPGRRAIPDEPDEPDGDDPIPLLRNVKL